MTWESMIWRLEDLIDLSRDGLDDLSADLDQTEVDLAGEDGSGVR